MVDGRANIARASAQKAIALGLYPKQKNRFTEKSAKTCQQASICAFAFLPQTMLPFV